MSGTFGVILLTFLMPVSFSQEKGKISLQSPLGEAAESDLYIKTFLGALDFTLFFQAVNGIPDLLFIVTGALFDLFGVDAVFARFDDF